jgi:DNA adenine methylase
MLAAFWKVALFDTDWLISKVGSIDVSLKTWDRLRTTRYRSNRDLALACLFLNRTSFSGILSYTAGPIGGRNQASNYSIDCRFNRETIVRRLREVAAAADRVAFVAKGDYQQTVEASRKLAKGSDLFLYFDPPFYNKAERLYRYFFTKEQHRNLRDFLVGLNATWFLSYDAAEEIMEMYKGVGAKTRPASVELLYSASSSELRQAKEIVVSNLPRLPRATRLWWTQAEWRKAGSTFQVAQRTLLRLGRT